MADSSDKLLGLDQALAHLEEANERVNKRAGRDLASAIFVGLILGAGVIVTLFVVDKQWFILFGCVLVGAATVELARAFRHKGLIVPVAPVAISVLAVIPITFYFGVSWAWVGIAGGIALTVIVQSLMKAVGRRTFALGGSAAAAVFTLVYTLGLGSFSIALVALPNGQNWTLSMLILAVSADVGAFAAGVLFGKHLMAPRISPKKTWEGFAGAVVAVAVAGVFLALFSIDQPIYIGIVLGVLVLITATAGDLFESQLKRWLGIKDMSNWLAGHGGFLDRLDSILPSGFVVYVLYLLLNL
ncbi:MAG: phosphatidate cytidylyltransferase [Actinobacteria bacterium]|nr:phosphatidate cytidylyltransferase [Actinomycetota bacterium]